MKIGIDYHGVLDTFPFFRELGRLFVNAGHEVHIITGAQWQNEKLQTQFEALGLQERVNYTHFASMTDFLIDRGEKVEWEDENNPFFSENAWNQSKSIYCIEKKIDMHFDDSSEYCKHFSTPYFLRINIGSI